MKNTLAMFNIPNFFTAFNMLSGVFAILCCVTGNIHLAPFAIFIGAILDFFDGFLARLLKQQGELGKQLDSLADMITFGLAPGIMMLVFLTYVVSPIPLTNYTEFNVQVHVAFVYWYEQMSIGNFYSLYPFLALIIPFFSLFRLAKFNIDLRQSDSFIGLNTPANTIFFTSFPLICSFYDGGLLGKVELISFFSSLKLVLPFLFFMSFMLVSEIPFFSFKFKSFRWEGNQLRFLFIGTTIVLILSLTVLSIPIIILLYTLFSIFENLFIKKQAL
jgi:CDP-diacylglycerol--serine O-phosphatidyltransferase